MAKKATRRRPGDTADDKVDAPAASGHDKVAEPKSWLLGRTASFVRIFVFMMFLKYMQTSGRSKAVYDAYQSYSEYLLSLFPEPARPDTAVFQ